jgi:hypothetical protein
MTEHEAQRAADQLALALEDVGFDVGRAFPELSAALGGGPAVDIGRVAATVAADLAKLLTRAAGSGITLAAE